MALHEQDIQGCRALIAFLFVERFDEVCDVKTLFLSQENLFQTSPTRSAKMLTWQCRQQG